jgi:hypothetical protein
MINNKYMVVTKFGFRKKKNQNKSGLVAHKTQTQHPIDKYFFVGKVFIVSTLWYIERSSII